MDEAKESPVSPVKGISRKKFFGNVVKIAEGIAATAFLAQLGGDQPQPKGNIGESIPTPEKEKPPSILIIDFFGDFDINQVLKERFPEAESLEQLLTKMGVTDSTTQDGLKQAVPTTEQEALTLLLFGVKMRYQSHGETVSKVREKTEQEFGLSPKKIRAESLYRAIGAGKLSFDELGNPTLDYLVSPEMVEQIISQSEEDCVNLSFETGRFPISYQMYFRERKHPEINASDVPSENTMNIVTNEKTVQTVTTYQNRKGETFPEEEAKKIIAQYEEKEIKLAEPKERFIRAQDGYEGANTYDNLSLLAAIAKKHPQKIFTAAAGNPSGVGVPDITEARERLIRENNWPDNLLMIGVYGETPYGEHTWAFGADFYVKDKDIEQFGFQAASSFATPVATAIVSQLRIRNKDPKWVKETLRKMSDEVGIEEPCYILNFDKVKQTLQALA